MLKNRSQKTSLKVLCQPVSGYDDFLFCFLFFFFFFFVIFTEDEIVYNSCNYVWFFLSFSSFTTEEIMSVVHFKTVMSEVIGTNIQVFFFCPKLFVPAFALPSFFLFTAKRWKEVPFLPSV